MSIAKSEAESRGNQLEVGPDMPSQELAATLQNRMVRLANKADREGAAADIANELAFLTSAATLLREAVEKGQVGVEVRHWTGNTRISPDCSTPSLLACQRIGAARGLLTFLSDALRSDSPESFRDNEAEMAIGGIDLLLAEAEAFVSCLGTAK